MDFRKGSTSALVMLALCAGGAQAQTATDSGVQIEKKNTGAGTTAAEFLLLGAGARGMALGPAFAAMTRDVEALYYNPASLPLMDGMEFGMTLMPYYADTRYMWAGLAMPLAGGEYGFGLSISNFGFSDAPVYTEADQNNESNLTYGVSETVLGLSFAHSFIDRFSGGVTLKLISDQLGATSAFGAALDIGTNYHAELAGRPISFAFVIQNLGTSLRHTGTGLDFDVLPVTTDPSFPSQSVDPAPSRYQTQSSAIPVVFRVGVAYDALSTAANRLTLGAEFNEAYNSSPAFGFSGEYAWSPTELPLAAALRGSYAYQPDNRLSGEESRNFAGATATTNEGLDGLALGGGVRFNLSDYQVRADYAWRHFGMLGSHNVFTVSFGWR
jgi:hypothetical protein